jgi:hypothetical protein
LQAQIAAHNIFQYKPFHVFFLTQKILSDIFHFSNLQNNIFIVYFCRRGFFPIRQRTSREKQFFMKMNIYDLPPSARPIKKSFITRKLEKVYFFHRIQIFGKFLISFLKILVSAFFGYNKTNSNFLPLIYLIFCITKSICQYTSHFLVFFKKYFAV